MNKMWMNKRWVPQPLPRYLTDEEYSRVILEAEKLSLRDRAIVLFPYPWDRRRSEVANLLIQDVDVKQRTAEVSVKVSENTVYRVHKQF